MQTKELRVIHGTQQSFYKKAFVKKDDKGIIKKEDPLE